MLLHNNCARIAQDRLQKRWNGGHWLCATWDSTGVLRGESVCCRFSQGHGMVSAMHLSMSSIH